MQPHMPGGPRPGMPMRPQGPYNVSTKNFKNANKLSPMRLRSLKITNSKSILKSIENKINRQLKPIEKTEPKNNNHQFEPFLPTFRTYSENNYPKYLQTLSRGGGPHPQSPSVPHGSPYPPAPSPPVTNQNNMTSPNPAQTIQKKKKQKLATTAYVLYSAAVHSKLRNESPHSSFGEISKMIGERWRGLPDKDRKIYEDQARANAIKNKEEEAREAQETANGMNQQPLSPMGESNQSAPTPPPQAIQNQQPNNVRVAAPPTQNQPPAQNIAQNPPAQAGGPVYTKIPTQRPPQMRPIVNDYEYPEAAIYEPPKPMFINPRKSKRQVLHTRMYQNYRK